MGLSKNHPALGAFLKKKPYRPDWEYIANELAPELRKRMDHPDDDGKCMCTGHLALRIYDEGSAKMRGAT